MGKDFSDDQIGYERFLLSIRLWQRRPYRPIRPRRAHQELAGRISVKDLRHILTSIGEKLEGSEFDEWIKEVEVGPDGTFKYEDLIQKITAKWSKVFYFLFFTFKVFVPIYIHMVRIGYMWWLICQLECYQFFFGFFLLILRCSTSSIYYSFFYYCCKLGLVLETNSP